MDPAVLIFLLYVMIAHELVCGWMQYRRQSNKPRKAAAGPLLRSRQTSRGQSSKQLIECAGVSGSMEDAKSVNQD